MLGHCSAPVQRLLRRLQLHAWLGRSDKCAGESTDNLAGLLLAKLLDPFRQGCAQLVNAVAAGYFQIDLFESDIRQQLMVLAVGECPGDAA